MQISGHVRAACLGLGMTLTTAASAQMAVQGLDHPLPEQLLTRAEPMVRALRPHDTEAALASLKTAQGANADSGWAILRVEANCIGDRCMTVIARIEQARMVPELILIAGRSVLVSDVAISLWGEPGWAIGFKGLGDAVIHVVERDGRWVVGACSACALWDDPAVSAPSTEPPALSSPAPESFETFRRALGLDPA